MISTVHERPGVYSSYEVSGVVSANAARKTVGVAAAAAKGETEKVVLLTSYAQGVEVFGEDAEGAPGMAALLKLLFANGAFGVKAVAVAAADGTPDYEAAFALLNEE
ncbi:MAG: phage tail sheath protein, partial [Oscillospiraceae bacterium]|nr:phage tail sheath protein [Oscillospiraceae bacterium]MDY5736335.1 phage tail sheath protein [Oscillospiraceae bacterium]